MKKEELREELKWELKWKLKKLKEVMWPAATEVKGQYLWMLEKGLSSQPSSQVPSSQPSSQGLSSQMLSSFNFFNFF